MGSIVEKPWYHPMLTYENGFILISFSDLHSFKTDCFKGPRFCASSIWIAYYKLGIENCESVIENFAELLSLFIWFAIKAFIFWDSAWCESDFGQMIKPCS